MSLAKCWAPFTPIPWNQCSPGWTVLPFGSPILRRCSSSLVFPMRTLDRVEGFGDVVIQRPSPPGLSDPLSECEIRCREAEFDQQARTDVGIRISAHPSGDQLRCPLLVGGRVNR